MTIALPPAAPRRQAQVRDRAAADAQVPDRPRAGLAGLLTLHRQFHVQIGVTERLVRECPILGYDHQDGGRGIYR